MIIAYVSRSRAGLFKIQLASNGRWHAMFEDEDLGSYARADQALDDLVGGHTFSASCGDTAAQRLPAGLGDWGHDLNARRSGRPGGSVINAHDLSAPLQRLVDRYALDLDSARNLAATLHEYLSAHDERTADAKVRGNLLAEITKLEMELPEIPVLPKLFANDATPESLATSVHEQNSRFAIISDEGGVTETLGGLYSKGAANIDILLKGIDGGAMRVLRRDRTYDLNPILTIVLVFQPQILLNIAGKQAFRGNGLLERFLFLLPESKLGYRNHNGPPMPLDITIKYHQLLERLLAVEPITPEIGEK